MIFDIEFVSSSDALLLRNKHAESISYIISCCKFDGKLDPDHIMSQIKSQIFIHKYYTKLKKVFMSFFGIHYWKKTKNFDLREHVIVLKREFTNDDQIFEFMNEEVGHKRFDDEKPQWKLFIIPNLPNNKSGVIMKIHHGITDGLSLMSFILNLGNSKDFSLVKIKKIKKWEWILVYLLAFLELFKFFFDLFKRKKPNNLFLFKKPSGEKISYCSPSLDLKILKEYAKENDVSMNELFLALLTKALCNHYKHKFNQKLESFSLMLAASTMPMPERHVFHPLTNNIGFIPQDLILNNSDDFDVLVKAYNQKLKNSKASYSIYFQKIGCDVFYTFLHSCVNEFLMNKITSLHSGIFTNVPGPTSRISLFGYDVEDIFFLASDVGKVNTILNILSYNNRFNLACFVDKATGINPKELIEEFTQLFKKTIILKK